ncbi:uncharacterized protein METZ01_LOCUS462955 [marine metagenome]|uniref:Uncharacterized protein n=1 Tax=marine metagenome TaxID=408172 RepID=A0A383AR98_9ZZZZ
MTKRNPPRVTEEFLRDKWYCSRVGVEGFEPPTSCSQSSLLNDWIQKPASVSVTEIEPFSYKQKSPRMWG